MDMSATNCQGCRKARIGVNISPNVSKEEQAVTPAQQFGPMRVPKCNHKVTGSGYRAVDRCEAETSTKALVTCSKSVLTSLISS